MLVRLFTIHQYSEVAADRLKPCIRIDSLSASKFVMSVQHEGERKSWSQSPL